MIEAKKAEENIKKFMEKHGPKGFLILYFSKYLFKLLKFQLKSKFTDIDPEKDPAYIFYTKNGKVTNLSDVEKYENELYEVCKQKAKIIVGELEKNKTFSSLFEGDFSKIKDSHLEKKFEASLHEIFQKLQEGKDESKT